VTASPAAQPASPQELPDFRRVNAGVRACLKMVALAILADVEPDILPGGLNVESAQQHKITVHNFEG